MRPKLLNVRIGWTLVCLTATTLSTGLLILSYEYDDRLLISELLVMRSSQGYITVEKYDWAYARSDRHDPVLGTLQSQVRIHYVFSVVASVTLAYFPWLARRFTIRTLLIVTTLVAVVLGLIVWL
jgi:hypothetical protein